MKTKIVLLLVALCCPIFAAIEGNIDFSCLFCCDSFIPEFSFGLASVDSGSFYPTVGGKFSFSILRDTIFNLSLPLKWAINFNWAEIRTGLEPTAIFLANTEKLNFLFGVFPIIVGIFWIDENGIKISASYPWIYAKHVAFDPFLKITAGIVTKF